MFLTLFFKPDMQAGGKGRTDLFAGTKCSCLQFLCRTWHTFRVQVSTWNMGWDEMGSGTDQSARQSLWKVSLAPVQLAEAQGHPRGDSADWPHAPTSQHSAQGAYLQLTQGGRPLKALQNPIEKQLVFETCWAPLTASLFLRSHAQISSISRKLCLFLPWVKGRSFHT